MAPPVNIVSTGARTPLGIRAPAAAAAVRAGITSLADHPFMIDQMGEPMPGALDALLDPSLMGWERFLPLAESALREACEPLGTPRVPRLRLPVFLGLPELRPGFTEHDADTVRSKLAQIQGFPIEISDVSIFTDGHAAGIAALAEAEQRIRQGMIQACLVGGVETYFHPETMEWLDLNRQLAGSVARSAFVPGEGAAFCLLMSERTCAELGLGVLGRVLTVAIGKEVKLIKTSDSCLGTGLTTVVQRAAGTLGPAVETIDTIICDINGERYRSEEWGFVCLRLSHYFNDPTAYRSPAECWGDMGAASGPLFVMLACQAAARGYSEGPRTLLWASSEGGLRGAAMLGFGMSHKV